MIDKKYYDLLEVEEGANKEKIIKAYDMLLLRARHDETIDIVAINKAYDILTGNVKV
jgi:DnaJ-class molecular chaperone